MPQNETDAREAREETLLHDLRCHFLEAMTEFFKGTARIAFGNGFGLKIERAPKAE